MQTIIKAMLSKHIQRTEIFLTNKYAYTARFHTLDLQQQKSIDFASVNNWNDYN